MNTKQDKLIPKLRFPEFESKWFKLNFIDLIIKANQGVNTTTEKVKYSEKGIQVVRSNNIGNNILDMSNVKYVTKDTYERINDNCKPQIGDILYCNIGSDLGSATLFNLDEEILINWNVFRIKTNNEIVNNSFLTQYLNKIKYQIRKYATESTMPFISSKAFKFIKFDIPQLPEQQKIASFLSDVDAKITQLIRKRDLLEQYKKGVMQKIFSQETDKGGSRTLKKNKNSGEQLRFKDDNGNAFPKWEEKRIKHIAKVVGGGTPSTTNHEFWDGGINWFTPTEIKFNSVSSSNRKITSLGLKKSSATLLPKGTILLTTRATIGEVAIANEECTTNQGFQSLVVNSQNSKVFVFYLIQMSKNELYKRANGSTFKEISKKEIEKIKVFIPCLEEQTKIANFLSDIDKKIEDLTTKIEQSKAFKKGLLQQLFV